MSDGIIRHEDRFERWWAKHELDWSFSSTWEPEDLSDLAKAAFLAGATSLLPIPNRSEKDARS